MLFHHLRIALRNLRKYKSQTVIGVLGLTTACVVFAVCCFIAQLIFSRNTAYPEHERMYQIKTRGFESIKGNMYQPFIELSGVEKFTASRWGGQYYGRLLKEGIESERILNLQLSEADTTFWSFFSLQTLIGSGQSILNTPNSIVLYESKARQLGELDALLNSPFMVDSIAYTITGILKTPPVNSTYFQGDGLVFNQQNGYFQRIRDTWNPMSGGIYSLVMLKKGISPNDFQAALENYPFVFDTAPNSNYKEHVYISSVSEVQQEELFILSIVCLIGLLVLFVALFNVISFQTAQFYNRLKECAIRKVAGSGKGQLLLSFYSEIFILFVFSFLLGLITLDLLRPVFEQPEFIGLFKDSSSGMRRQLFFSIIFGLTVTFLFCLIPVQIISRQSVRVVFMGLSEKVSRQRGRKIMLFVQMLILLLFLSGASIVQLQVQKVKGNIWHTLSAEDR
jgi:hypothetical protein